MFKISEELMAKIESILSVNTPALAEGKGLNIINSCGRVCTNSCGGACTGSCGSACTGSCAGSCRGTCTRSCQRNSR